MGPSSKAGQQQLSCKFRPCQFMDTAEWLASGHAAINVKEDVMIIDDVAQGVALYKLSTSERVRTFPVPSSERRSRNVAFHDGGSAIVCGSDHGIVYIFDRKTGDTLDAIDMGIEDWVQSVVVRQDHAAWIILSQTLW